LAAFVNGKVGSLYRSGRFRQTSDPMSESERQRPDELDERQEQARVADSSESAPLAKLVLRLQEIPLDDPESKYLFQPSSAKPFVATPAALERYGRDMIVACLQLLQRTAAEHKGVDYLQVFEDPTKGDRLWFMEDDKGGAITALLPSDY